MEGNQELAQEKSRVDAGGRVFVGKVGFRELSCDGDSYVIVSAIPQWGVYLFIDVGRDCEIGFDYRQTSDLLTQLKEAVRVTQGRTKQWERLGGTINYSWCDREELEDSRGSLMVEACHRRVMLTIHFDPRTEEWDMGFMMNKASVQKLIAFVSEATSRPYRKGVGLTKDEVKTRYLEYELCRKELRRIYETLMKMELPHESIDDDAHEFWTELVEYDGYIAGLLSSLSFGPNSKKEKMLASDPEIGERLNRLIKRHGERPDLVAFEEYLDSMDKLIKNAILTIERGYRTPITQI
jgi:hypothetical protein